MSQNTLIEKIKNDAAKAVEEIKTAGAAEIKNVQRAVEVKVAELTKAHKIELEKKKAQMELVAVSKAKQAGNIAVQTAKRKEIDAVFSAAMEELASQDVDDYVSFFANFVSNVVPKDVVVTSVRAPKNRTEETKRIMSEIGIAGEVEEDNSFKAGMIITSGDGVYDVTLERLMNEKRAELEMTIVNKIDA